MDEDIDLTRVAICINKSQKQRAIGAAVHRRCVSGDDQRYSIELIDFADNEQFSNLDSLFVQIGKCIVYLPEDFDDSRKGDGKKIYNILLGKDIEGVFVKRSWLQKKSDTSEKLQK